MAELERRLFNRRLTRLTLGFSKKLEHPKNSVALSIAHYNFCRVHHSLQGEAPAMAARLTDHVPFCKDFHEPELVTTIDHDSRERPQPQLA